jgi:hypothetical protein
MSLAMSTPKDTTNVVRDQKCRAEFYLVSPSRFPGLSDEAFNKRMAEIRSGNRMARLFSSRSDVAVKPSGLKAATSLGKREVKGRVG